MFEFFYQSLLFKSIYKPHPQFERLKATTHEKGNDQQQHAFNLLYVYSVTSFFFMFYVNIN